MSQWLKHVFPPDMLIHSDHSEDEGWNMVCIVILFPPQIISCLLSVFCLFKVAQMPTKEAVML